jgi:hypothetical protein
MSAVVQWFLSIYTNRRDRKMLKMTKTRIAAAILSLVLAVSVIPAVGGVEAQAETNTKVMETNVNFINVDNGQEDNGIYVMNLVSAKKVTLGKKYSVSMSIYVPAAFMKKGRLWVDPRLTVGYGTGYKKSGTIKSENGYDYEADSESVTKVGDFYKIEVEASLDTAYSSSWKKTSFPTGKGNLSVVVPISGFNVKYNGSIYLDDIKLSVDGEVVASADYEDGKVGSCSYTVGSENKDRTPKVVSFDGESSLTVSKTALTIKKGKTATIKTTAIPNSKVTFASSDKKVATVSSKGVVKGIKKGKATITVKANGKTVEVKVTVK